MDEQEEIRRTIVVVKALDMRLRAMDKRLQLLEAVIERIVNLGAALETRLDALAEYMPQEKADDA